MIATSIPQGNSAGYFKMVTHPIFNPFQQGLTSEKRREPVSSLQVNPKKGASVVWKFNVQIFNTHTPIKLLLIFQLL